MRVEVDLEGDGEPSLVANYPDEARRSGEYWRGATFKPVVNGTWPVVVTATDALGRSASTRCTPGMTVTY